MKLPTLAILLVVISVSESHTLGRRSAYRDPYRHTPTVDHVHVPSGPFNDPDLMPAFMSWPRSGSIRVPSAPKHPPKNPAPIVFEDDDHAEAAYPLSAIQRPVVFVDDTINGSRSPAMDDKRQLPTYPDDEISWVPRINRSSCLLGALCEDVPNYPTEAIARLMESGIQHLNLNLSSIFSKSDESKFESAVLTRNNVDRPDEKPLCETKRMTMHLKSALNTDKEFRFIINSVEYSQKVMTEICTGESKPCSHVTSPIGSETVCRQKYVEVYLLAVNEVGKPVMDTFRIPSSCVCYSKLSPNARTAARSSRSS